MKNKTVGKIIDISSKYFYDCYIAQGDIDTEKQYIDYEKEIQNIIINYEMDIEKRCEKVFDETRAEMYEDLEAAWTRTDEDWNKIARLQDINLYLTEKVIELERKTTNS